MCKTNRLVTLLVASLCVLGALGGHGYAAKAKRTKARAVKDEKTSDEVEKGKNRKGDTLEGNLGLLNQWGQQTETVNRLYTAAYKVLAAKSECDVHGHGQRS